MERRLCEVKKALAAVRRICKAGNVVQFGSEPEECYIENKMSRKRVALRQKGGSYVMNVHFVREGYGETMYVAEINLRWTQGRRSRCAQWIGGRSSERRQRLKR